MPLTNPNFPTNGSLAARLAMLAALLMFLVVGFIFAAPCLCDAGAIRGRFTMALLTLGFGRIAWEAYKCTFFFKDYFFYLAVVILLSIWANFMAEN